MIVIIYIGKFCVLVGGWLFVIAGMRVMGIGFDIKRCIGIGVVRLGYLHQLIFY